jgi:hypothetical protein
MTPLEDDVTFLKTLAANLEREAASVGYGFNAASAHRIMWLRLAADVARAISAALNEHEQVRNAENPDRKR